MLSVRLTSDLARRLDAVLLRLARDVAPIRVSRSDAIRAVLERGLAAFEHRRPKRKRRP